MRQKITILGVAGGIVLVVALTIAGCSDGGSSSPTAPPDPVVPSSAGTASGNSGDLEQVNGPGVYIEKATNGFDADVAPGPSIEAGMDVTWTYDVTNIGDVTLVSWVVTDDMLEPSEVCRDTDREFGPLEPMETVRCTATGTAIDEQYANIGTVEASDGSTRVDASDPSHYLGGGGRFSAIQIEKSTQVDRDDGPQDADYPTGPIVLVGEPVIWIYQITNIGQVALEDWLISDDRIGDICRGDALPVRETQTCTSQSSLPAVAGQYSNVGLVRAFDGTTRISDEDLSHYFGSDPSVSLDKRTNGADGPRLIIDCPVTWTYEVTNTGNIDLDEIAVRDRPFGDVTCPAGTILTPGESVTCEATSTVIEGQYNNRGTVTASDPIGTPVEAFDDSSYFGTDQCSNVVPSRDSLWPPNHRLKTVELMGDVCGEPADFTITRISQDEPINGLGDGDTSPDGVVNSDGSVELRAERSGTGDGRVYHIDYTASQGGVSCEGSVTVGVPHDQGGGSAVDSGPPYYDSDTGDVIR